MEIPIHRVDNNGYKVDLPKSFTLHQIHQIPRRGDWIELDHTQVPLLPKRFKGVRLEVDRVIWVGSDDVNLNVNVLMVY